MSNCLENSILCVFCQNWQNMWKHIFYVNHIKIRSLVMTLKCSEWAYIPTHSYVHAKNGRNVLFQFEISSFQPFKNAFLIIKIVQRPVKRSRKFDDLIFDQLKKKMLMLIASTKCHRHRRITKPELRLYNAEVEHLQVRTLCIIMMAWSDVVRRRCHRFTVHAGASTVNGNSSHLGIASHKR